MKNILVVGANGMLGYDLVKVFTEKEYNVEEATRKDFDVTKIDEVERFFKDKEFDLVINSTAYTQVDKAEEEKDLAFLVNETGAKNLSKITNQKNIPILYVSTDYVFDGAKGEPYDVNDKTNPINVYGESKLAGEIATRMENKKSYIVRTSWLYGKNGKNFVDTMLLLSERNKELKVVNDQFGCPTWTYELAKGIESLFSKEEKYGIYHICGSRIYSWYEFALKIFSIKRIKIVVNPVSTKEFPVIAKRPRYSALNPENSSGSCYELEQYLELN